MGNVVLEQSGL